MKEKEYFIIRHSEPTLDDQGSVRLMRSGLMFNYLSKNNKTTWLVSKYDHFNKRVRGQKATYFGESCIRYMPYLPYRKNVSMIRVADDLLFSLACGYYVLTRAKKGDVVISSWPTIFAPFVVSFVCKRKKISHHIELRDLWPDVITQTVNLPRFVKNLVERGLNRMFSYVVHNSDIITCPSNSYKLWVKNRTQNANIIISRLPFLKSKKEYCHISKVLEANANGREIIIFFGTIGRMFDFETIIEFSKTKQGLDYFFAFFGSGDRLELYKNITLECNNVKFYGRVELPCMHYLADMSHYSLAPYINSINFKGHIPNKIGEYLSYSLPIIHSLHGEANDLLSRENCGVYYEAGDLQTLSAAFENLDLLQSTNMQKVYEDTFSIEAAFSHL
jgi:glycosyltransferase involved in cell wall biosynthesis